MVMVKRMPILVHISFDAAARGTLNLRLPTPYPACQPLAVLFARARCLGAVPADSPDGR